MKHLLASIALIPLLVPDAHAGCRVNCHAVEQFVAVPAAVVTGVPVAAYAPYQYTYQPTPNVTVHVHLDKETLAGAVKDALGSGDVTPPPPIPGPLRAEHIDPAKQAAGIQPPTPFAGFERCIACHLPNTGTTKASAVAKFNLSQLATMDCKLKLRAIYDIRTERMPPPNDPLGGKLNGDEAGVAIEKLSKE